MSIVQASHLALKYICDRSVLFAHHLLDGIRSWEALVLELVWVVQELQVLLQLVFLALQELVDFDTVRRVNGLLL